MWSTRFDLNGQQCNASLTWSALFPVQGMGANWSDRTWIELEMVEKERWGRSDRARFQGISVWSKHRTQPTQDQNTQQDHFISDEPGPIKIRPIHSESKAVGQTAWTDFQPAASPIERLLFLEGQSAGLASVATRSMKTLAWRSKTWFQKTEMSSQRSSFEEYPFTSAASTASESIKRMMSAPNNLPLNVSSAISGATISTGTICVLRGIHFFCTCFGTTAVNWDGAICLLSKITPPTRSASFSFS